MHKSLHKHAMPVHTLAQGEIGGGKCYLAASEVTLAYFFFSPRHTIIATNYCLLVCRFEYIGGFFTEISCLK